MAPVRRLLLTVLGISILGSTAIVAPSAAAAAAVLSVDDRNVVGVVGDMRLSLAEALQVMAGDRSLSSLSAAERRRVAGDPRKAARRLVKVTVGRGVPVHADGPLPTLARLAGVVLDGGGAVLTGSSAANGTAFLVASSNLTIQDFGIKGFGMGVAITPAGTTEVSHVRLDRLHITASSMCINITAADGSGSLGTVRDIRITRGRFQGVAGGSNLVGVNVVGQSGSIAGVVDGVQISDNWFGDHMLERVQLVGVQAVASATATGVVAKGSQLRNVTVARNTFTTCPDPCVLAYSALALGGQISGAGMHGIRIEDNVMPVSGLGVVVISGYTLAGGSTDNSRLWDVAVRGNKIRPAGPAFAGKCQAILVVGDWTDFHAGLATTSSVSDVLVADNQVTGCARGVLVAGTFAVEEVSGSVRESAVSNVSVRNNTFEANTTAVQVAGAGLDYTRLWGKSPTSLQAAPAVLEGNSVRGVVLDGNTFIGNGTVLFVAGSAVTDTNGNIVANNTVTDVRQLRSVFKANQRVCRIVGDARQNSLGVDHGNSVTRVVC